MANEIIKNIHLVNAPAGSGKTYTIEKLITKHLISCPEDKILCITFTNRAAEELMDRINSKNVDIGTIHSYINNLIKTFYKHKECLDLYWECYKDDIIKRINNVKKTESNERYKKEYGELNEKTIKKNIIKIKYNEKKYSSYYYGELGHDDLIKFSKRLIDKYPVIRRKIADKYKMVYIDEYQDTFSDVLKIFYDSIKNSNCELYLMGDKMQQIYSNYDGSFEKELVKLDNSINLETNYRSTKEILNVLNKIYNVKEYEQKPSEKNFHKKGDYPPRVIISKDIDAEVEKLQKANKNSLVLYLLNDERFKKIGAYDLFNAFDKMNRYSYGRRYGASDVLIDESENNPDELMRLLSVIKEISDYYEKKLYGEIIIKSKSIYKKFLSEDAFIIHKHEDKAKLKEKLDSLKIQYCKKENIKCMLEKQKELNLFRNDIIDHILKDKEYETVLDVNMQEYHALMKYLTQKNVSTQHGVKGEGHDTVVFVAENHNGNPYAYMKIFLKLFSMSDVSFIDFEKFYYDYNDLYLEIKGICENDTQKIKSAKYQTVKLDVNAKIQKFIESNKNNDYYNFICKELFDEYIRKDTLGNFKKCIKNTLVYGVLSAYKLFYVGCSRAEKNLTIIIDEEEIQGFENEARSKFEECGFEVFPKE